MLEATIIGSIAVWRLTHMFQEETGPKGIFEKLRAKIWTMENTIGGFREGFFCFKCMSIWQGLLLGLLYFVYEPAFWIISVPLTLSAIAIFINDFYEKQ